MEVARERSQKQQNTSPQEVTNKGKGILQARRSTDGQKVYGANKGHLNYISTEGATKATDAITGMFPAFAKTASALSEPGITFFRSQSESRG